MVPAMPSTVAVPRKIDVMQAGRKIHAVTRIRHED